MNNGANIIEKIKSDAEAVVRENIAQAEEKARGIIEKAERAAAQEREELEKSLGDLKAAIIGRRVTVAGIDSKKILLLKKTAEIDNAFRAAEERIACDKRYKAFLIGAIKESAEDGDAVALGFSDKKVLSKADVDKIAEAKKIRLSLDKEAGEFAHGVILKGEKFDKNFILEDTLLNARGELLGDVADCLFGGEN